MWWLTGACEAVSGPVLAVDIGGTKVAVAVVRAGQVIAHEVAATPAAAGPEAVVTTVVGCAARLAAAASLPENVGVACAGIVSEGRVRAMSPELLPGWHDFPLAMRLTASLRALIEAPRVAILNDAQAAALGEQAHGAGRGRDSLLFVTVSTGVGGGLIVNGRVWRGATGLAGHIGHMRGRELENIASGTALARRAAELGHAVDARQVIDSAQAGAEWARGLLTDAATALARALADVRVLLDPEVVVLGGGVGLNDGFRDALEQEIRRLPDSNRLVVVPARLGTAAGLIGAATWAESNH